MADDDGPKKEEKAGAPGWMCTFADLMSLLLCFFVLLLSFSVTDNQKYKQVAGSMKDAFGIQREQMVRDSPEGQQMISQDFQTVPLNVQVALQKAFAEEVEEGAVEAEHGPQGMILRIKDAVAFASGSAEIRKDFYPLMDRLAQVVEQFGLNCDIGGHTDDVPVSGGQFSSNFDLSASRAVVIAEYWQTRHRIAPHKLSAIGHADGKPIDANTTAEGRARNRRVEFLLKPGTAERAFEGIEGMIQG